MTQSFGTARKLTSRSLHRGATIKPVASALLFFLSLAAATATFGQSAPVQVGSPLYNSFQIPITSGTLSYSLSAADRVTIGYSAANEFANTATFSGDLGYLSASVVHPFNLVYSGGYLATTTGQPSAFFQNVTLTQTLNTKNWRFTGEDTFHYLPETPSTGLSGILGVGDVGVTTGVPSSQDILTPFSTRIENHTSLDVSRKLTGSTSLDGMAYYAIQRFLGDSDGIETNDLTFRGTLSHRIDARNSYTVDYTYTHFSYLVKTGAFVPQTVLFDFTRKMNRKLELGGGAGPERISSSTLTGKGPSYTYSAKAHLAYIGSLEHGVTYTLNFIRSTNSGSGITFGAQSNTVTGSAGRRFTRSLEGNIEAHYAKSSGLQLNTGTPLTTESVIVSAQANRAVSRTLSIYASYSVQHQIYSGTYQGIRPLDGISQILGFGLTYSPTQIHVGRQ
jgi:hypothetical protein